MHKVVFHMDDAQREKLGSFAKDVIKLGIMTYKLDEHEIVASLKLVMDVFGVKGIMSEYNTPTDSKTIYKGTIFASDAPVPDKGDKGEENG